MRFIFFSQPQTHATQSSMYLPPIASRKLAKRKQGGRAGVITQGVGPVRRRVGANREWRLALPCRHEEQVCWPRRADLTGRGAVGGLSGRDQYEGVMSCTEHQSVTAGMKKYCRNLPG